MIKILVLFILPFIFISCQESTNDELRIGFVAGLTGKYSTTGADIRDGFMLAFDDIDYRINNQKIKIIQKDDKQDPVIAKEIIEYFIKNNIQLIVGNTTSSMTRISLKSLKNKNNFLLASAIASSNKFSHIDDNFIRIQVEDSEKQYSKLNTYLKKHNIKKVFYIYDKNNYTYTKGYFDFYQNVLIKNNAEKFIAYKAIQDGYDVIIDNLKKIDYDMILIVASSSDTANLIQHIKINKINKKIMISEWAYTNDFIEFGGKSIDGVIVSSGYDKYSNDKDYLKFIKKFKNKYNKDASMYSVKGYELAKILIKNIEKTRDISKLKELILKEKIYKGLQGKINFDKYGDVSRDYFLLKVINDKFQRISN